MIRISWPGFLAAFVLTLTALFLWGGAFAASNHTQSVTGLDRLLPREQWAGAGLDKLTPSEQQTLADDISSLLARARTTGTSPATTKDRTQWRKLQRHMTRDDVKQLLGDPNTVSVSRFYEAWNYPAGSVTFNSKGHLEMWTED